MFKLLRIPRQISDLLAELEMFFTLHQWIHFQTMLLSLLITPYKATVRGRSRVLAFGTHRTKHNEFLQHSGELLGKALQYYALKLIALLEQAQEAMYVIVDDSKTAKRGKHVQAAFRLFDHTTQRFLWGHQFVCVTLLYRGMTIPYAIELYRCKADCHKRHLPFRKLTQIAKDLIAGLPDFGIKRVYVLADTYYASKQIIRTVRARGFHFVSFLKSNRRLVINGRSTSVSKFLKRSFRKTRKHWISFGKARYATVQQACYLPGLGEVSVVFSQKKGRRTVLPLFATDSTLTTKEIIAIYRKRWSIEVLFKQTKQYLGLTAYHHRDEHAVRTHLQLVLLAYALLTHLFLTEQRAQGKTFTTKLLATFSPRETQQRIRALVAVDTLDCIQDRIPKRWIPTQHYKEQIIDQIKTYLLAA
ncbi:MAG: transposase [Ignavibacteria bacterium]|nr:transposase [Ignavibacteria bacterium]